MLAYLWRKKRDEAEEQRQLAALAVATDQYGSVPVDSVANPTYDGGGAGGDGSIRIIPGSATMQASRHNGAKGGYDNVKYDAAAAASQEHGGYNALKQTNALYHGYRAPANTNNASNIVYAIPFDKPEAGAGAGAGATGVVGGGGGGKVGFEAPSSDYEVAAASPISNPTYNGWNLDSAAGIDPALFAKDATLSAGGLPYDWTPVPGTPNAAPAPAAAAAAAAESTSKSTQQRGRKHNASGVYGFGGGAAEEDV